MVGMEGAESVLAVSQFPRKSFEKKPSRWKWATGNHLSSHEMPNEQGRNLIRMRTLVNEVICIFMSTLDSCLVFDHDSHAPASTLLSSKQGPRGSTVVPGLGADRKSRPLPRDQLVKPSQSSHHFQSQPCFRSPPWMWPVGTLPALGQGQ